MMVELAAYVRLPDQVVADVADVDAALFRPASRVFADIADVDGVPVRMALWFYNFSTFVGRHGIWLEDLFVQPDSRGSGAGTARLARLARLARRCVEEGLGQLECWVLDWNTPALGFYARLGAEPQRDWTVQRLSGAALVELGAQAS